MPHRAPSPGRLTLVFLCLAILVGLFLAARCKQEKTNLLPSNTAPTTATTARLTMVNDSHCDWQIVITLLTAGERHSWKLAETKSLEVELTGGDYEVEQTMLTDDAGPDATRRFPLHLEAGQNYRWRLVTLLSGAREEGHE